VTCLRLIGGSGKDGKSGGRRKSHVTVLDRLGDCDAQEGADGVILSACNTAGAQTENAEDLSRTMLSHWAVGSDAAVKLTTRAIAGLKTHPKIGRSEAFRVSMKELIEKGSLLEAHPKQWAPFVVVGEGAR